MDVRKWLMGNWNDIVAPGDEEHLWAGAKVEQWFGDPSRYVLKELGLDGEGPKEYQNQAPDWFEKPGRSWGVWGLKPEWKELPMDGVEARRLVRRYLRAKGYRVPVRWPAQGCAVVFEHRETVDRLQNGLQTR